MATVHPVRLARICAPWTRIAPDLGTVGTRNAVVLTRPHNLPNSSGPFSCAQALG
jgi:hypothetical protein